MPARDGCQLANTVEDLPTGRLICAGFSTSLVEELSIGLVGEST